MKNLFPRLSRIVLNNWLEYHPYQQEVASDHFYIDLSNRIQHEMLLVDVEDQLVGVDYKNLACMLACYLEDIVGQTGMWTSFVNEHRKLYGKYLPFYDMTGYEYDEINLADVQFLIWHFCSNLPVQSRFVDPYSIENEDIARVVFAILDEAAGDAPVNEDLQAALILPHDADIHEIEEHLNFVFMGCYLHQFYFTSLMESEILDVKNQNDSRQNFDSLVHERRTRLLFNHVSPLLALRSGEILASWVGASHPLYNRLRSLSKRKEGIFLYEGESSVYLQMRHIASGLSVELNKPEPDFPLVAGETAVRLGIVQWGDEWYATGPVFPVTDNNNGEISEKEKYLFAPLASHLGVVKREEECFFEANYNKRIVILENKFATFDFIDKVWELYHLKYGAESMNRKMFDIHKLTFYVDDDFDNLIVFFNPRSGMEFYPNIAQCISIWDNTYFRKDAETDIEDLILDERVSSEFIFFLIENQLVEIEPSAGNTGFHYVRNHCDFLLRYWKKERYVAEPELFVE